MLKKLFCAAGICAASLATLCAETIQLKEKSAISGKILAEKKDQIAVDVGYTVLLIPKNQIARIIKDETTAPKETVAPKSEKTTTAAATTPAPKSGFYSVATKMPPLRSVRELVNQLGEAVVQVRTPSGLGSGFIINEEGYLITNFHVIEGETQISIEVYHQTGGQLDRKSYKDVRIIAINKFEDIALLKIDDKSAPKFSKVFLGDSDNLSVGEQVFAIGSPLGLERTVTQGILSTKTRQIQGELYLQTTAQINPGNSGGPLFNMSGEVIGVTNMKITFGEGLGFAIPMTAVKFFLEHRDAYAYSNDNPSNPYRYLEPPGRTSRALVEN
jgi:serine protease Do